MDRGADGAVLPAGDAAVPADDAVSTRIQKERLPLYASRIKVYPKRVAGRYRRLKWGVLAACLAVYYLAPWLRWDRGPGAPDQAVLIDMAGRRAYWFGIEIWPQEVYYLTGLLILAAIGLFLVTSLLGRVWCGYACPQTVWTDLFMWVERLVEGDRNARMKLDRASWTVDKLARKAAKHAAWLAIAALTGGAWVLYFNDAPTVTREILTGRASGEVYFFVGMFTATTYILAGWAREQVCTYMCPWPRFQAAMFDEQTLTVTYQGWRGEPRGKHRRGESWAGRGDCVDCGQCVAVCPTGIDIRDGQQLECIGCGLCVDACNGVMDKVGRPRELITFATLASQAARARGAAVPWRLLRPRVVIYVALLATVGAIMLAALWLRPGVEVTVLRERSPLFVTLSDGAIRNGYTLKILNKAHAARTYELTAAGPRGLELVVIGAEGAGGSVRVAARPDAVATLRLHVRVPREALAAASTPVRFVLRDLASGESAEYESVFLGPEGR